MFPYFLALPLPSLIRQQLALLCYGLPNVRWVEEENFHLTLRYLGPLTNSEEEKIKSYLTQLFFRPFFIQLQRIGHFHSKKDQGVLWVGIQSSPPLIELKKRIDRALQPLKLPKDDRGFQPHVTLGRYQTLNKNRLEDYLLSHLNYESSLIEINQCILFRSHQTPKHLIYESIETYSSDNSNLFNE